MQFPSLRDIGIYFCVKMRLQIIFTSIFSVFLFLEDLQNLLNTFTFPPPVSSKLGQQRILENTARVIISSSGVFTECGSCRVHSFLHNLTPKDPQFSVPSSNCARKPEGLRQQLFLASQQPRMHLLCVRALCKANIFSMPTPGVCVAA